MFLRLLKYSPGTKTLGSKPFWGVWNTTTVQHDVLEGPQIDFWARGRRFGMALTRCVQDLASFLSMFLNIFLCISNGNCLADHCFSNFDFPDVKPLSKQSWKTEQSSFGYLLGGKVYRGLKLCQTSPFIVVLRSQIGLGRIAKRKQF